MTSDVQAAREELRLARVRVGMVADVRKATGEHGHARDLRLIDLALTAAEERAATAERERDEARALAAERLEALRTADAAMREYYRYWTGGETRGSYDGKPERNGLWKAMWSTTDLVRRAAITSGADHGG